MAQAVDVLAGSLTITVCKVDTMAYPSQHFTQYDQNELHLFSYLDVSVGDLNGSCVLRAPLFSDSGPSYIVEVDLIPGQRPNLRWTLDQSNMQQHYFDADISNTLYDGEYMLDSRHVFSLVIDNGKPSRPDFVSADWGNKASCCVNARAFTLVDPGKQKTSTYTQVSTNLIVEVSHNRNGCAHFWRRRHA